METRYANITIGMVLTLFATAGCHPGDYAVNADVMPGVYPNQIAADQSTIEVALLAPEPVKVHRLGNVEVVASSSFELDGPSVAATGSPVFRDVNGDGVPDLVATFSVSKLREAGLVGPGTSRLSVRASIPNIGSCTGTDRLFDAGNLLLTLPSPSGSEPVGTTSTVLYDTSRPGATSAGRAVVVRLWYPAKPTSAEPTTYFLDDREAVANVPQGFAENLFDGVHSWSLRDVEAAQKGRRPALIMSTGLGLPVAFYSGVAQDLASHGYVIVGIEHPDGSGVVVYPDGTTSQADPAAVPDDAWAYRWVGDIEFVLGWLGRAQRQANLGRAVREVVDLIDQRRIGAFGHSFGGAASVWAATETPALRASANIDGAFWGDVLQAGPKTPSMIMLAEGHLQVDTTPAVYGEHARAPVYTVQVAGTQHLNFSDMGTLVDGLRAIDPNIQPSDLGLGTLGSARSLIIESAYLRAFFGAVLSAQPSSLLEGPSADFPEVTWTAQASGSD